MSLPRIKFVESISVSDKYINYVFNIYKCDYPHLQINIAEHEYSQYDMCLL